MSKHDRILKSMSRCMAVAFSLWSAVPQVSFYTHEHRHGAFWHVHADSVVGYTASSSRSYYGAEAAGHDAILGYLNAAKVSAPSKKPSAPLSFDLSREQLSAANDRHTHQIVRHNVPHSLTQGLGSFSSALFIQPRLTLRTYFTYLAPPRYLRGPPSFL